jgi:hypothetical protein
VTTTPIDSVVASIVAQPVAASWSVHPTPRTWPRPIPFPNGLTIRLTTLVDGWSAFVTFQILERFKLIGEYVAALDNFKAGEIYDAADTNERKPSAWNVEAGALIVDSLELAVRYGGSDDGTDFLPESQYGAVLNWGFLKIPIWRWSTCMMNSKTMFGRQTPLPPSWRWNSNP